MVRIDTICAVQGFSKIPSPQTRGYQGVLYAFSAMSAFFFRWLKEKGNLEAVTVFDYGVQKRHTRWAETRSVRVPVSKRTSSSISGIQNTACILAILPISWRKYNIEAEEVQ